MWPLECVEEDIDLFWLMDEFSLFMNLSMVGQDPACGLVANWSIGRYLGRLDEVVVLCRQVPN